MEELFKTNDIVLISFVESLLKDAGIASFVADQNISAIEGSIGVFPRRVMVPADRIEEARRLMRDAGVGAEVGDPSR